MWPQILRQSISLNMSQPFVWGQWDCSFVFDIVRDMTGFDPIQDVRGYSTEAGALKRLKQAGYTSALDLVERHFVEIAPATAQRGDIGYPMTISRELMSPAIIDGVHAFSKEPSGGVLIPRSSIARAWRV